MYVIGWVFQQYVHFVSAETDPLKVVTALGYGPNLQILLAIGCVEVQVYMCIYEDIADIHLHRYMCLSYMYVRILGYSSNLQNLITINCVEML
jgi:hypothetical protein